MKANSLRKYTQKIQLKNTIILSLIMVFFIVLIAFDLNDPTYIEPIDEFYYYEGSIDMVAEGNMPWQVYEDRPIQAKTYVLKIPFNTLSNKVLYLDYVGGDAFEVYDQAYKEIYTYKGEKNLEFFSTWINESYVPFSSRVLYIQVSNPSGQSYQALGPYAGVLPVEVLYPSFDSRKAIALILIILAMVLLLFNDSFMKITSKRYLAHTGYFLFAFGLWALLDFHRHAHWIRNGLSPLPLGLLVFIYILSSNLMAPLFLKLNQTLNNQTLYKKYIYKIYKVVLVFAIFGMAIDGLRFITWNEWLQEINYYYRLTYDSVVALGSFALIIFAWKSYDKKDPKSLWYAYGLTGALMTFAISQLTPYLISHWGVLWLLFFVIGVINLSFRQAHKDNLNYIQEIKAMNASNVALNKDLKYTQKELLLRLGSTVDLKSKETSQHVQRVSVLTEFIAKKMGYSKEDAKIFALASTLHDIGKVGIPDKILNENGKLSEEDFEVMKDHARMGFEILNGSENALLDYAAIIAWTHHEKYDGSGYPSGLKGEEIPMIGAIVAAADVFDALLSERVYKKPWSFEKIYDYYLQEKGKHFHPLVSQTVIDHYDQIKALLSQ